jgi:ClpP class serine protease
VYGNAASAAYWIASAADEIIVGATGMVGSIGVVMSGRKMEDGEWELVNSDSPNKRPDPDTTEGKAELRRMLNGLADVFVETVARNRNTTPEAVTKDFGRGGMMLPKDALKVGMIDGVSTLADYMAELISGRPVSKSIDNPPPSLGRGEKETSASSNPEESKMNLSEFLKEHPEASAEIEAIKAQALAAGRDAGKLEATAAVNERNAQASAILASDSYPATIKGFASGVLSGKNSPEELKTAVIVFDAMKAESTMNAAVGDSAAAPATPPQTVAARSTDHVLRNAADIDAEAAAMKAGR